MQFKRNLYLGFFISLALTIISSTAAYISINSLLSSNEWVLHTDSVLIQLENIVSTMKDAETGQRGYLLTGQREFLEPYNGAAAKIETAFNNVTILTRDNPRQQLSCQTLKELLKRKQDILANLIVARQAGAPVNMDSLKIGNEVMNEVRSVTNIMREREKDLLVIRTEKMNVFARVSPILIIAAFVIAVISTIVFYRRIYRNHAEINDMSEKLVQKDKELAEKIAYVEKVSKEIAGGDLKQRVADIKE